MNDTTVGWATDGGVGATGATYNELDVGRPRSCGRNLIGRKQGRYTSHL
jgi:hypothetical protein